MVSSRLDKRLPRDTITRVGGTPNASGMTLVSQQ